MFPPAPGVIFDYLMLNTPSDASCTPLYSVQPDRREGGGQPEPDRINTGRGVVRGDRSDCCYQLKLSAPHSDLTPLNSMLALILNTISIS